MELSLTGASERSPGDSGVEFETIAGRRHLGSRTRELGQWPLVSQETNVLFSPTASKGPVSCTPKILDSNFAFQPPQPSVEEWVHLLKPETEHSSR